MSVQVRPAPLHTGQVRRRLDQRNRYVQKIRGWNEVRVENGDVRPASERQPVGQGPRLVS